MGALGVNFTTFKAQEERVQEYRQRIQHCEPAGAFVNDQLASANFLFCHEDSATGVETGSKMIGTFQYLAGQLDMAKEAWPTKGYPSPGLLAATRRSAASPAAAGEPPEGIAIGNPEQVIRELKKWESTGVDLVNFILNANETIPQEQVLESLRTFGREVMPAFATETRRLTHAPLRHARRRPRRPRPPRPVGARRPRVGAARRRVPADQLGGRRRRRRSR